MNERNPNKDSQIVQARIVASSESAVGGGQPVYDIRNMRDHHEQRPVDIAEALNCPALAAMLSPQLSLHLATAGSGCQVCVCRLALQSDCATPSVFDFVSLHHTADGNF